MADSHDHMTKLHAAVDWCNENNVDYVLHGGDLVAPFINRAFKNLNAPYKIVFGNNDGERHGLSVLFKDKIFEPPYELELDGKKIAMLHEPDPLDSLDKEKYDLILYGHTHAVDIQPGPPLIVNPGELCGWLSGNATMALWDTTTMNVEIISL
jgi:putative phosphoesterase